jgi:hypothetical protein
MYENPSNFMFLAKQRHAECLREIQQIRLAERAAPASGPTRRPISRLLALLARRRAAFGRTRPALQTPTPR